MIKDRERALKVSIAILVIALFTFFESETQREFVLIAHIGKEDDEWV